MKSHEHKKRVAVKITKNKVVLMVFTYYQILLQHIHPLHVISGSLSPRHKKGDKTDCDNYRGISLLPTTYKILSNILLSRLIAYAEEIIGDHQCEFRCNRSITNHIFSICQILEKKNGNTVKQCISYRLEESL